MLCVWPIWFGDVPKLSARPPKVNNRAPVLFFGRRRTHIAMTIEQTGVAQLNPSIFCIINHELIHAVVGVLWFIEILNQELTLPRLDLTQPVS